MKHTYKLTFAIALFTASLSMTAQPALMWGARYNAPPDMGDESRDIVVDAAGNVYVTGSGFNSGGNLDAITIKYDANGNQMWVRNYDRGANSNDEGKSIALDAAGNVYITGYSTGSSTLSDALTVKYDNAGTQQWAVFYNGAANNMDEARAIAVDASGNVFICGYTSDSAYFFDALTVCYNTGGTQQWAQVYNDTIDGNDELMDLVIDASSNVYVTGNSEQDTAFNYDFLTIKYNSAGIQQWLVAYAGPAGGDFGKAIALDANNNVIVGGQSGFTGNWFDYLTVKYSNAGVQQWTARYNNGNNKFEDLWAVSADNAGCVYVTGQSQSTTGSNADLATVKYSPAGTELWVKRYDGGFSNADDRAYAMVLDDTANVYVAGYSRNATNADMITVKYDSSGTQEFVLRFNSQYDQVDQVSAIAERNGDVYVTGKSANATNEDFMTIRYSYSAVGVQEFSTGSLNVFPNPCADVLTLDFGQASDQPAVILITDIAGRTVMSIDVAPGTISTQVDISELSAGTYMIAHLNGDGDLLSRTLLVKK